MQINGTSRTPPPTKKDCLYIGKDFPPIYSHFIETGKGITIKIIKNILMEVIMRKILTAIILCTATMLFTACGSTGSSNSQARTTYTAATVKSADTSSDEINDTEKSTNSQPAKSETVSDNTTDAGSNILVAYFSRADENYGVGVIEKGNTQIIAEMISEKTGGEMFHIQTLTPYPTDYDECTDMAKQELNDNARPQLDAGIENIDKYDVIYLGYPIWWGDMPMAVYTFMESYDLSDKTIIPFCTHAGSGISGTDESIKSSTGANVLDAFSIEGETAQNDQQAAKSEVDSWLDGLGIQE